MSKQTWASWSLFIVILASMMFFSGSNQNIISFPVPHASASPPSAPLNVTATGGANQVSLVWITPTNNGGSSVLNYTIYRGIISGQETLLTSIGNYTFYNDTGLGNGTIYYYRIAANNTAGLGVNSTEVSATTATIPGSPTISVFCLPLIQSKVIIVISYPF